MTAPKSPHFAFTRRRFVGSAGLAAVSTGAVSASWAGQLWNGRDSDALRLTAGKEAEARALLHVGATFDTLDHAAKQGVPSSVGSIVVNRYDADSEYCPTPYVWAAAAPPHDLSFAAMDTGFFAPTVATLNSWAAGVSPNRADSALQMARAVAYAKSRPHGGVYTPAGLYLMNASPDNSDYMLVINGADEFAFTGDGPGVTVFRVKDGAEIGGLSANTCRKMFMSGFTLDGNRENNTDAANGRHGLRLEDIEDFTFTHFEILNTRGYGIGMQGDPGNGSHIRTLIAFGYIDNVNRDGMDVKNRDGGNADNTISHLVVTNVNKLDGVNERGEYRNNSDPCLDLRGPWNISNVFLRPGPSPGTPPAILIRPDPTGDPGGRNINITNFWIDLADQPGADGIIIQNYQCDISNGVIVGMNTGHQHQSVGIQVSYDGANLHGRRCNIVNVNSAHGSVQGPNGIHFDIDAPDAQLTNCRAYGSGTGFDVASTAALVNCTGDTCHTNFRSTGPGARFTSCTSISPQAESYSGVDGDSLVNSPTLSDWKTFTPAITAATAPDGVEYATQLGKWRREGNTIRYEIAVGLSNRGSSGAGEVYVTGMPVPVGRESGPPPALAYSSIALPPGHTQLSAVPLSNSAIIRLTSVGSGQAEMALDYATGIADSSEIRLAGFYSA